MSRSEDFAAVDEARLQPRDGVDRIGQRLAAVGPQCQGAPEQPRLAGELGGDDLAGGHAARLGIDRPPVLQKAQRGIVVRAPDEPGGSLGMAARQQQQADIAAPQLGQHAGRQDRVAAQYHAFQRRQRDTRREGAAEPHGQAPGVDIERRALAVEIEGGHPSADKKEGRIDRRPGDAQGARLEARIEPDEEYAVLARVDDRLQIALQDGQLPQQ